MTQYQVVYQGYEPEPNQVVTDPVDFDTANWLACELQGEAGKDGGFYIFEPIIQQQEDKQ